MKSFTKVLFLAMVGTLMASCAAHQKGQEMFRPQNLSMTGYEQKVDNFLVILDASGSKQDKIYGQKKLEYAKKIVSRMNQTIPNSLSLNSALRRYGKGIKESQPPAMKTEIVYPPGQYSKTRFEDALATVKKSCGLTFMEAAIDAGSEDLKAFSRKSAVIVVSDGKVHTNDPIQAAKRMKSRYGDDVCIYTIWIPSATADVNQVKKDKKLMEQIAKAGGCGFMAEADNIKSSQGMADFVRKVFLAERPAYVEPERCPDADGDGVCNNMDDCPNTPMSVAVDARGCPVPCSDADGDGVCDKDDECPGTVSGEIVNDRGCPVPCSDTDGDGVCDKDDECPGTAVGAKVNARGCPLPVRCSDSDSDGVCDKDDECPGTSVGVMVDAKGCCIDSDNDGVCDKDDECPGTLTGVVVDARGCCIDSDNDGVCNKDDECPNTLMGVVVDSKGCPVRCSDSDNDGVCDKDDECPGTLMGVAVDSRGCPVRCSDSDNDGVCDKDDECPGTLMGVAVDSRGCPIPSCTDSDGDGVCDQDDHCPNTPWGMAVDANGCHSVTIAPTEPIPATTCIDNDNDGVCDDSDDCLNTPPAAGVNARGCWIIENLLFDYDKSNIRERYYYDLDNVARILKENPYLSIEIQGHTDSIGSQKYNLPLSKRRAKAVVDYLIKKGIMKERLYWKGYGKERPVAPNDNAEGRQLNRRVELYPLGEQ